MTRASPIPSLLKSVTALCAGLALSACVSSAGQRVAYDARDITPEMLLDSSPLAEGAELADLSGIDMLQMTPEMVAFVDGYVDDGLSPHAKMQRLLFAVMGEGNFDLIYDDTTRTASGTFEAHHGNCLSFTNMFVAMARHLGLDAHYQEVEIPPDWSSSGAAFLLSQHVNVFVDFKHYSPRVVDFNISYEPGITYDFNIIYDRRVISDERARAHYFNNIGVEYMLLGGDTVQALSNYRESLTADPTFSPAWINLGILHRRDGYPEFAEAAYLRALELDPSNLVAMSNLASLYEAEGRAQQAEYYRRQVRVHRMRNPYYRAQLAQEDVIAGDYASARSHLRYAIRHRKDEDRFYFLMGLSYALSGDQVSARDWMNQAAKLAEEYGDGQRYHHKLELLMNPSAAADR
jgi:tetratricopeptide (TPR) repeat protein